MAYYDAAMFDHLERLWKDLGQEEISCGLPGFYSSKLAVTCLSYDNFLMAREMARSDKTVISEGTNPQAFKTFEEYVRLQVEEMLQTGTQSYGQTIWSDFPADGTLPADQLVEPSTTSPNLQWSSEVDRKK